MREQLHVVFIAGFLTGAILTTIIWIWLDKLSIRDARKMGLFDAEHHGEGSAAASGELPEDDD